MRSPLATLESLENRRLLSAGSVMADGPTADGGSDAAVPVYATAAAPKPSNGGVSLTEFAGQRFTARLGEFTLKVVDLSLNAVVDWGDGTHSAGKLVGSYATGEYYVQGTHTYARPGTYAVDVKVFTRPIGSPVQPTSPAVEFTSVVKAKSLKPSGGGVELTEAVNQKFTAKLGEFQYRSVDLILNAEINWGDGTTSAGKLVGSYATGKYYVQGTHSYSHTGKYKVDVKIFAHPAGTNIKPTSPVVRFTSVIDVVAKA